MTLDSKDNLRLEIGHVLFIDIVGYSKLLINEQSEQIQRLTEIVRGTEQVRLAEAQGKLMRLPSGDGGALVFRNSPEAPALCALEISKALKNHPELHVRMGIHSGPVNEVTDLNEQANVAGAGVNIAQRVMDCGDAGHVLVSKRVADDLEQYRQWRSLLHELGECEVKHGLRISILNLFDDTAGNPELPEKFRQAGEKEQTALATAALHAPVRHDEGFWVAVLPFKYSGSNAELADLSEGLTEEIVTGLSRFSYLRVIARGSTARFKNESVDVRSAGKDLCARYVMEGSIRQAGSKLRLAVQLVDAVSGAHLWAENYERTFRPEAIFELQDELVPRIVSTVADMNGVLPRSMSAAVRSRTPEELSPYEAVLRCFGYFERVTAEELAAARPGLELAVEKAPAYADAWAMLALLCVQDHAQGFNLQANSLTSGTSAARRAVEAAPSNHLAHFSLAQALFFQKEYQSFHHAAERAVALNPMDGNSIAFLGELLTYAGDSERGMALAARAKQLNPNHPGWYWYADFYNSYRQRDYRSALNFVLKANLPGHWGTQAAMAACYAQLGEDAAASKALRDLLELRPDFAETVRTDVEKWWEPDYELHLIDGLRKAGLKIAREQRKADTSV
jgi:TolB-like protein